MIKVNLLPGVAGKSQSSSNFNFGALLSAATAGIKDKFLIGAVATISVVVLAVGFTYVSQSSRDRTLIEHERKAMEDSTRFKVVLAAKVKAGATCDALYQQ